MANVLNRATLDYLVGVNTPDFPGDAWIVNPDLSAVMQSPKRYWQINDDSSITLKSAEDQAAADTLYLPLRKLERIRELHDACQSYIYAHYDQARQQSLNALLSEGAIMGYMNRIGYVAQALSWIKGTIGYYYEKEDEINSAITLLDTDAVTWNFASQFDATDPNITLRVASGMTN